MAKSVSSSTLLEGMIPFPDALMGFNSCEHCTSLVCSDLLSEETATLTNGKIWDRHQEAAGASIVGFRDGKGGCVYR